MGEGLTRLFDLIAYQKQNYKMEDALAGKRAGQWTRYSTEEFERRVDLVSLGLRLKHRVEHGDRIGLISFNRPEWNFVDMGTLQLGCVLVPLYPTASDDDYLHILSHSEVRVLFVQSAEHAARVEKLWAKLPFLEAIYTFESPQGEAKHWEELTKPYESTDRSQLAPLRNAVKAEDLASLIYTSGTTGTPKGVMLTHANIMSNVTAVKDVLPIERGSRSLSFLPLCHIFERMVNYTYLYLGVSIYYAESLDTIGDNLKEVKPDFFVTVPRVLEKVFNKILAKGEDLTGVKRRLFFWALDLGLAHNPDAFAGPVSQLKLAIARKLIFSKWREALGGRVKAIVSGGAALQPRLAKVFFAAGVPVLEGYGLTETSPVIAVNCLAKSDRQNATVGLVIPGVEVKIMPEPGYPDGEGEICCRGPNVMKGYYKDPEATKQAIDAEGWFHTGDIGLLQKGRFLKITDRKKEVFKTSGGKYIAPLAIENRVKESKFVEQVMVIGENRKFPSALIVPNFAAVQDWCAKNNVAYTNAVAAIAQPPVKAIFQAALDAVNQNLGHWEQIKKFELLPQEWTIEGGELTPKLSLKRRVILNHHKEIIESLYAEETAAQKNGRRVG